MIARSPLRFDFSPTRWTPPRGEVFQRTLRHDSSTEYYYYVPNSAPEHPHVLAAIHGTSRRARDYITEMAPHCEKHGLVLLAPLFGEQHRDFQRLGREGRGQRADVTLHRCLTEIGSLTGADITKFRLFGFSAGAQFAHRYMLAHPNRVAHLASVAAGWYTFPEVKLQYPYGTRPTRKLRGITFNPEDYLKVPTHVLVGTNDVGAQNLRNSKHVNEHQGRNRLERARRWVQAMRNAAKDFSLKPQVQLIEVAGVGHGFTDFCRNGDLINRVFKIFFPDAEYEDASPPETANQDQPANGDVPEK